MTVETTCDNFYLTDGIFFIFNAMFIHISPKRLRRETFPSVSVLLNLLRKMILEMMTFENFYLEIGKISSSMPCLYPSQQNDSVGENSQKTARYSIYYGK